MDGFCCLLLEIVVVEFFWCVFDFVFVKDGVIGFVFVLSCRKFIIGGVRVDYLFLFVIVFVVCWKFINSEFWFEVGWELGFYYVNGDFVVVFGDR